MTGNTHRAEVAIQLGSNVALANSRVSGSLQAKLTAAPMKAVISAAENSVWRREVNCISFPSLFFPPASGYTRRVQIRGSVEYRDEFESNNFISISSSLAAIFVLTAFLPTELALRNCWNYKITFYFS